MIKQLFYFFIEISQHILEHNNKPFFKLSSFHFIIVYYIKFLPNLANKQIQKKMSYRQQNDIFKYKKRLPIKSLEAAICNVALFKNMKQKQFKDTIYISYNQDGVILESLNQVQWQKACGYVLDFLIDKKIALLTYGYEKQVYEELIVKGLKQYTRKVKQIGQQCPYINIIHYQKLRKSCEYMDKQKYTDPLKYWQHKFKINPNFAFLVVQPKQKFYEVKRYLLQVLFKKQVTLKIEYISLWQFLYLFYSSKNKDQIRQLCYKKIIQIQVIKKKQLQQQQQSKNELKLKSVKSKQKDDKISQNAIQKFSLMKTINQCEYIVKIVNFSDLILNQYEIKIIKHTSNLAKLGLEYISSKQIEKQIKTISKYLRGPQPSQQSSQPQPSTTKKPLQITQIYDQLHSQIIHQIRQQNPSQTQTSQLMYSVIPYKKCQKQKYLNLLQKLIKTSTQVKNKNLQEINNELKKLEICQYDQIEFISILPHGKYSKMEKDQDNSSKKRRYQEEDNYHVYKVSINDCPFMVIEYHQIPINDLDTFILYLEQLKTYYCTYLVRFYGISIRYGQTIHQSHAQILQKVNPNILTKIQSSQSHSYKQFSKSKLEQYSYYLIFDYHHRSIHTLIKNDLILDNLQIANIALQLLYLCQYLHSHDEPRCLGLLNLQQIYWPLAVVLPYLGHGQKLSILQTNKKYPSSILSKFKLNCSQQGFEGDVKLIGKLIEHMMIMQNQSEEQYSSEQQNQDSFQYDQGTIDKELQNLYKQMIKESKYDRITITKAIATLEDIICV